MPSLTRAEAASRAESIRVEAYAVDLDLTGAGPTFRSTVTIRFAARGGESFVELKPTRLHSARLNGAAVPPESLTANRLRLPGLSTDNELVVDAEMAYANTGAGLHRFVDPADGRGYVYAMTFLDEAQRVFACFDQPDLKAPLRLSVTADPRWTVLGNAPVESVHDGRWTFGETPPLATYFMTLVAGAYHGVHSEHDGIPLGLYCRASLAEYLDRDADELFTATRGCLDRYHQLFGVRYPFGKYDQAFVPEFNAGAMENPGCVTLTDDLVFRSAVTEAQREGRVVVVAHEMAHMWFGDLVTMRWWDDLWLNESFADYLGVRVAAEATRFTGAWTAFAIAEKTRGYAADQRPSTHPVAAAEVPDPAAALLNFDGISYAKGAAALRQLVAWAGDDAFLAGLRAHLTAHAYGNATLTDLLTAVSTASGRDLADWAAVWLRQPQVNTLRPQLELDREGRYASVAIAQAAPPEYPVLRPHRVGVGLYDLVGARAVRRTRLDVDVAGPLTEVKALAGEPVADLLLINDGDLTYAKVRLDGTSMTALPAVLPVLADPVTRAVLWVAVWDAVRDAELGAADLLVLVDQTLAAERDVVIAEFVLRAAHDAVNRFLPPAARADALARLHATGDRMLAAAEPGGSIQLAAARAVITTGVDATRLRAWLAGSTVPDGLAVDADLRWRITYRLAICAAAGPADIDRELARDRSAAGEEWARRCRAALPDAAAKAAAWQALSHDSALSNRQLLAAADGFWQPEQLALTESYVDLYFAEVPDLACRRSGLVLERLVRSAYPRYAIEPHTVEAAAALLARPDLDPAVRREVVDADDDLRRALRARAFG